MIKRILFFFILSINYIESDANLYNLSMDVENVQPSGHLTFFKKTYKPFVIEKTKPIEYSILPSSYNVARVVDGYHSFGKTIKFSPLNDICDSDYEKNNAKSCLKKYPDDWDCLYEYCISLSRPIGSFITFQLPSFINISEGYKIPFEN